MRIEYDDKNDILYMEFTNDSILRDVSHGWNINVGYGKHGIVEITILDAKAIGYWPLENAAELFREAA